MLKVGIITGSTRPNRKSLDVAKWVLEAARKRSDAEYELVDIKDFELPLLDEPIPPSMGKYQQPHTKRWAAKIASLDAFVFVSPEYNHGIPGALKNAIDFLFAEWNHKAAGFVSYGGAGGARAVEQLRLVVERAEEVGREVHLGAFVRHPDEGGDSETVEAMDPILPAEAAAERERRAGILVGARQPADPGW